MDNNQQRNPENGVDPTAVIGEYAQELKKVQGELMMYRAMVRRLQAELQELKKSENK